MVEMSTKFLTEEERKNLPENRREQALMKLFVAELIFAAETIGL